ncbi:MAG: cytochrome c [Phycisphaerales bacterium]|nr:cytochrome c [Phycisphaerales bacterium]
MKRRGAVNAGLIVALVVGLPLVLMGVGIAWLLMTSSDGPAERVLPDTTPAPESLEDRAQRIDYSYNRVKAGAGEQLWFRMCFACHSDDGTVVEGPSFLHLYGSEVVLVGGTRVIADEEYLRRAILDPYDQVRRGWENVRTMPPNRGVLNDQQVEQLIEFIKSLAEPNMPEPPADETGEGEPGEGEPDPAESAGGG